MVVAFGIQLLLGAGVRHGTLRRILVGLWIAYGLGLVAVWATCVVACVVRDGRPAAWEYVSVTATLVASALFLPPIIVVQGRLLRALFTTLGVDLGFDVDSQGTRAEGTVQGCRVFVERHVRWVRKSKRISILVTTRFPYSLGVGLEIQRQGEPAKPDLPVVQTGDAEFDRRFIVQARNPEQALGLLTPQRRSMILGRLTPMNRITVSDQGLTERYNRGVPFGVVENAIHAGPAIAKTLLGASRPAAPPPPAPPPDPDLPAPPPPAT